MLPSGFLKKDKCPNKINVFVTDVLSHKTSVRYPEWH